MKALIFQGLGKKVPKNRNEAAKQLRAGLEPCFKLRLIIPIETPGVIDDFAQPPAHVAALVDGVTRLCPFSCSCCCGCWCTLQVKLPNVGSLVASDVLAPRGSFGVAQ